MAGAMLHNTTDRKLRNQVLKAAQPPASIFLLRSSLRQLTSQFNSRHASNEEYPIYIIARALVDQAGESPCPIKHPNVNFFSTFRCSLGVHATRPSDSLTLCCFRPILHFQLTSINPDGNRICRNSGDDSHILSSDEVLSLLFFYASDDKD
ncbi:hypothetical protein GALMADRAFT_241254 [Galerina marginata CBS 339.88]|uniref:Uncharacterized protein n=1 Tax=Galerina marginata (strain CBS 339.88) TaxID=685588 RepID=A0A067TPB0_GALM3|nr:hypothetical protein GALMADRAFT_241254 [Galerina marginata CBS 339.88]